MSRVLVLTPAARPLGGGEAVVAWTLQALQDIHRVTLLTWEPADLLGLNRVYGTSLNSSTLSVLSAPQLLRRLFALDPDPQSVYPLVALWRIAQFIGWRYDALVHLHGEANFGRRGIQYIHYPFLSEKITAVDAVREPAWLALLRGRMAPWLVLSGMRSAAVRANLTLANSQWTAAVYEKFHGVIPQVVYPPVANLSSGLPSARRPARFLCCGRWGAEKRYEVIIDIVASLRALGHDLGLTIVALPGDTSYRRTVLDRVHASGDWIEVHENLDRNVLVQIIGSHRYGIHAYAQEHFGIAPAEMASGGCIVFVPNDGGQVEIVGGDRRLLWGTPQEAVDRIDAVLRDPELQQSLQTMLVARAQRFGSARFTREMRQVIDDFIDRAPALAG